MHVCLCMHVCRVCVHLGLIAGTDLLDLSLRICELAERTAQSHARMGFPGAGTISEGPVKLPSVGSCGFSSPGSFSPCSFLHPCLSQDTATLAGQSSPQFPCLPLWVLMVLWASLPRMGGIPAVNGRGERLLLHIGIIDILQSYRWVPDLPRCTCSQEPLCLKGSLCVIEGTCWLSSS